MHCQIFCTAQAAASSAPASSHQYETVSWQASQEEDVKENTDAGTQRHGQVETRNWIDHILKVHDEAEVAQKLAQDAMVSLPLPPVFFAHTRCVLCFVPVLTQERLQDVICHTMHKTQCAPIASCVGGHAQVRRKS